MTTFNGLIVGGGISGLAFVHWLGRKTDLTGWELWEAENRLGGTIGTDREDGYSVDWGPNGFLDREPLTRQLVEGVGLTGELEPANDNSEDRFIVKNNRLHPVPLSPLKIITTGLLNPIEKLRIFGEPFIPARRDDGEESIFDFAARRIGRGAAATFVDPMVSGVFGGIARELSLPACFPIMREMEMQHGGLVRAMIARMREKRRREKAEGTPKTKSGGPAGPGGRLTSFRSGLDVLTERMGERSQSIIRLNRAVAKVVREDNLWTVIDTDGSRVQTRNLVFACPTLAAAAAIREFDYDLADALSAIPYAPIIVVATGHRQEDIRRSLDGFGFLIPRNQKLRTLGSIWTSSIFADRAPKGFVQFRTMLGGAGDPGVLSLSDDELWQTIHRELDPLLGIKGPPVFSRIYRWEYGIPQYTLGHRDRRARIEQMAQRHPGLHFIGNAFYGVGLNDCVKLAHRVAATVATDSSVSV